MTFVPPPGRGPWAEASEMRDRAYLFIRNQEALQRACLDGSIPAGQVAVLADGHDTFGMAIARRVDPEGVAREIAAGNRIPIVLGALPLQVAIALMFDKPQTVGALSRPVAPGHMAVLVVAAGGADVMQMQRKPSA